MATTTSTALKARTKPRRSSIAEPKEVMYN